MHSIVKEIETNAKTTHGEGCSPICSTTWRSIRTGRASVGMLDDIRVDYYGTPTPLNQVATLHVPEPAMITVQPWDVSQIGPIEKAIRASDLGLNPANDGKIIRMPIPPLTEERRKELVKKLHGVAEDHRVARPQHPPRRQRSRQEAAEGQDDHRGRGPSRARRDSEDDRWSHAEAGSGGKAQGKGNPGRQ